jgi:hypothetical protein
MTPEQQQLAIAEACGRVQRADGFWFPAGKYYGSAGIPDYLNDLNAMHEAEKVLVRLQWVSYLRRLQTLCDESVSWPIHATASQRAEAFLRTIGKWEEAK